MDFIVFTKNIIYGFCYTTKTNVMEFNITQPVRSTFVLSKKIIEQVNHFNYLGNEVGFTFDLRCSKYDQLQVVQTGQ